MDSWYVALVFVIVVVILPVEIKGMVNGMAEMLLQSLDITVTKLNLGPTTSRLLLTKF